VLYHLSQLKFHLPISLSSSLQSSHSYISEARLHLTELVPILFTHILPIIKSHHRVFWLRQHPLTATATAQVSNHHRSQQPPVMVPHLLDDIPPIHISHNSRHQLGSLCYHHQGNLSALQQRSVADILVYSRTISCSQPSITITSVSAMISLLCVRNLMSSS